MDWAFFKKDLQYIFLNQIVSSIPSWTIRNFFYKCSGMKIGPKARIGINTVIISPKGITIGCRSVINDHCVLDGSGGITIKNSKYQIMSERFSDFVDVIADWLLDDGKILREFLTPNEYSKVEDKLKSLYSELILLDTDNKVDIFYHDKLLRQHSIGQRASALILFILTHNDTDVIIIDQPEDDLDNKVIYDEVLKVIRAMKMNTQFIFATHNANIPVLGDAEMILAADSDGESITYQSGNIDTRDSQQQIITIMEGGTEAFARRRLIYSSWSNQ